MSISESESSLLSEAFRQSEAICALEGMNPDATSVAIKNAVISGRVTGSQAVSELCDWVKAHQSVDGFIASRSWI